MGFKMIKCGGESVPLIHDYLAADNEAIALGEGLALTNGRLTKVGATAVPEYISEAAVAASAAPTVKIPVHKVRPEYIYEVACTGQITSAGAKHTIHSDGASVTTTTNDGVFEVTYTDGAATSKVRGHF